jgi:hypothetical protein
MAKGSYRSARSGRFVTAKHGQASPGTTVRHATGGGGSAGGTYRSAKTGRFVTTKYGKANPSNTIKDN